MPGQAPAQPSADQKPADQNGGGDQKPDQKPAQAQATATSDVDLAKLPADQLTKVLENPELFKLPRIQELMNDSKEYKKLAKSQQEAEDKQLKEQQKWEELASKKTKEADELRGQFKTLTINQALTTKLVAAGVVDLDGALKLADRSKIEVGEDGQVKGVDEAFEALKSDKAYLFNADSKPATVGSPTNPNNGGDKPSGPSKFKRSQITPAFYAANKADIDAAALAGLIEDDGPAPAQ